MSTSQRPIGSGFGAATTADEVITGIDLRGKVAVVTGGYSGIGLETARVLRAAGAEVVVPARDLDRATAAVRGLDVEVAPVDLLDPASIDAFAARFAERPVHVLVNSAGIMAAPLVRDARGHESQFATNHLGHFRLTTGLLPALRRAGGARVVSVSSWGHRFSPVVFDDVDFAHRDYDRWAGYGQSKTANILFALDLDRRGRDDGVRAFSLHPGNIADTALARHMSTEEVVAIGVRDADGNPVVDVASGRKSVSQGAATSVWCATSPQLADLGGVYCENVEVAGLVPDEAVHEWSVEDSFHEVGVMPYAVDPEAADRLWALSELLTAR